MTRQEIINLHEKSENLISFDRVHLYRKSLAIYFASYENCDPESMIFAVHTLTNNLCFGRIVCPEEFSELEYILSPEEFETLNFNSFFLLNN